MSAPEDLWRTPQAGPYGGFHPNVPSGYPSAAPAQPAAAAVDLRGETAAGLVVLVMCVFLGAPLGLLWAALRPKLDPLVVSQASESALKPQFTADLKLALLGLAGGAVAGAVAWALVRRHGTGAAVGLALGGYAAMRVAAQVGRLAAHPDQLRAVTEAQLGPGEMLTGTRQQISEFLDLLSFHLRAGAVLYTFSIGALLLFGVLTYVRDSSSREKPYRLSWDSAADGSVPAPARPSAS